jgi:hypothetical protein
VMVVLLMQIVVANSTSTESDRAGHR